MKNENKIWEKKIKDIGKIHLGGTDLDVELNHGTRQNEKV